MSAYSIGHSDDELARLELQGKVSRPITERLLRAAGLAAGAKVLDIGCGVGMTSLLLAELVGPEGTVLAIDPAEAAVDSTRRRVEAAGLRHVSVERARLDELASGQAFDFVFGRYIVFHQEDPIGFIKQASSYLRPGGTIAFHEIILSEAKQITTPPIEAFEARMAELVRFCQRSFGAFDIPRRLVPAFAEAGLPLPDVIYESPAAGADPEMLISWAIDSAVAFRRLAYPHEETPDRAALVEATLAQVKEKKCQVVMYDQVGVWARLPEG